MSHFLSSSHTCSIYCPFKSFSYFPIDTHQVLLNSCGVCSFQQDPVFREDWKSTVRLGRKMSRSTLRTRLSDTCRALCWGFTLPPRPASFHCGLLSLHFLPISPFHCSCYFFISLSPFHFPLLIFSFHRSPFHLNCPRSFPHPSLPFIFLEAN